MAHKNREIIKVDDLNEMQRYLGEETIEDYQSGLMSRRRMLRRLLLICGSSGAVAALLVACGDATATPTSAVSSTTVAPTTASTSGTTAPAATTAANTTAVATTSAATTASTTTAASATTAAGTTAATGTTSAASKSPLSVPANDPAIEGSDVTYQSDTTVYGYLARPKASGTYPGVIVIHENRGLTDHIKDVTRRLAKAGYIALAPDLASRAGGSAKVAADQIAGYFANAKNEDLVKDLSAGVDFLAKQNGVKQGKYGVVGFCYGGGMTLRLAAANPKIGAAVSYYGPVPQPVSQMSTTQAAILGQYGETDSRVNAGVPDLEKTLKDSGKTFDKKIYSGAGHAFNNDTGASYNEAAALAAWKETLGWFDKYLKA
ncbi:MAG TPA: dienelactone hydrolase family protein [Chloroflexia bacterium]|nr:dienelactone hydrolase family protein [Chloroflexia bacterium]